LSISHVATFLEISIVSRLSPAKPAERLLLSVDLRDARCMSRLSWRSRSRPGVDFGRIAGILFHANSRRRRVEARKSRRSASGQRFTGKQAVLAATGKPFPKAMAGAFPPAVECELERSQVELSGGNPMLFVPHDSLAEEVERGFFRNGG
jgi:hypothetical protein